MICLPDPFSQDVTVRLDIMALNLSVLNKEEPYQLRERGAPRFCLCSTTGVFPLWAPGLRGFPSGRWVCRGALSLLHSQPLLCLTWVLFPGALQRVCMHACVRQTAPPHPKGMIPIKKISFKSFPHFIAFAILPVISFFIYGLIRRICVQTSECQIKQNYVMCCFPPPAPSSTLYSCFRLWSFTLFPVLSAWAPETSSHHWVTPCLSFPFASFNLLWHSCLYSVLLQ